MNTATLPKIQSASELGLMAGFPPLSATRVTTENQFTSPFNRWSFLHEQELNPCADVWRGEGQVAPLHEAHQALDTLPCHNRAGMHFTFGEMVEQSYTDGIIVLHQSRIIYERYLNGMQPHTRHAWASCSKSVTGTLAAMLIYEGVLDPAATVASYLPELTHSGFADATVRQVADMTTALKFSDDYGDAAADTWRYSVAMGLLPKSEDYTGPETIYDYLSTVQKDGAHGERFAYVTPNTDVLAWLIKRVLNQRLADVLHTRIWSKLGAERDALWLVDQTTAESAGSGLVTTLRDMARFGQMMLQQGFFNGQQIVPAAVVEAIAQGGDVAAFARGPAASPMNPGASYRDQWWHNAAGAYYALGYAGQILYIVPALQLVVAKFSSYPAPAAAGAEFYMAFAGIAALMKMLENNSQI